MSITVNVYHHFPVNADILTSLNEIKELIMSTQAEITDLLNAATAQMQKVAVESAATLQKVADLEAVIASMGTNVSPELQAAVDALRVQVQLVDDLVPDAPVA
jgi:translation initiation factor IF-2